MKAKEWVLDEAEQEKALPIRKQHTQRPCGRRAPLLSMDRRGRAGDELGQALQSLRATQTILGGFCLFFFKGPMALGKLLQGFKQS